MLLLIVQPKENYDIFLHARLHGIFQPFSPVMNSLTTLFMAAAPAVLCFSFTFHFSLWTFSSAHCQISFYFSIGLLAICTVYRRTNSNKQMLFFIMNIFHLCSISTLRQKSFFFPKVLLIINEQSGYIFFQLQNKQELNGNVSWMNDKHQ